MYKYHTLNIMTRSLNSVTYFPMYYTHMALPYAGATSTPAEFLFHFILANSGDLCCPVTGQHLSFFFFFLFLHFYASAYQRQQRGI